MKDQQNIVATAEKVRTPIQEASRLMTNMTTTTTKAICGGETIYLREGQVKKQNHHAIFIDININLAAEIFCVSYSTTILVPELHLLPKPCS